MIFLAEKASADSQWCGEELEYWCNPGKLNRTENLIIILIDDDIVLNEMRNINFEQTTALHPLLRPYLTSIPLWTCVGRLTRQTRICKIPSIAMKLMPSLPGSKA
ncbi:MAG: hypothetical protein IPH31_21905 [Lewinellaceae bacterium]|nr:hypothetical protein [Lewinellaceae bacterium]